jgi:inositol phosphorylceramide synthase catalytic subunit
MAALLSVAYLLLAYLLVGFNIGQPILAGFFLTMYYASRPTRRFIVAFSAFVVFWIIFDFMKAFPNYRFNTVHIRDLYQADKYLFNFDGLSANEYWQAHHSTLLDILSGCFYLSWMPVPLAFGVYLYFRKRARILPFALTFLWVNLLGFVIYYLYPAAPPWYVQQYGFDLHLHTPGNTAGLHRFDDYFHIHIFQSLYAQSSNVFAAMPSLHAAYPLVTLYHGISSRVGWLNVFLALVVGGIWFAAVYTSHHYVLDVLAGIGCALLGILLFERGWMNVGWFRRWLDRYQEKVR